MAKPIKVTPVLKGKDAVNFFNRVEASSNTSISEKRIEEIKNSAALLQSIYRSGQIK